MKPTSCCPECGKFLSLKKERCRCGWKLPVIKENEESSDGRCEYHIGERRCPLPGTICNLPYGKSGWYCSGHWNCLSDPRLGEAVLLHAEKNYQKILSEKRDWRDVLIDERINSLHKKTFSSNKEQKNNNQNSISTKTEYYDESEK